MLDFIFGFNRQLAEEYRVRWSFNLNHLLLVLAMVLLAVLLYKLLPSKNKRSIIIVKISLISIMFMLEVGRMLWEILRHMYNNEGSIEGLNWFRTISFTMCAINTWITIGVIIATIFVKVDNKALIIFKNILYGSALLGGIAMFIYPENLDHNGRWHILHFRNSQTILQHFLLAFVSIYLIKVGELNVRLKNIWMPLLGLLGAYSIIVTASHVGNHNFTFALSFGFGNIPYPFHKIVMGIIIFLLVFLLYIFWEISYKVKNKKIHKEISEKQTSSKEYKYLITNVIAVTFLLLSTLFGPLLFGASDGVAIDSPIALVFLIPLLMLIITMIVTSYLNKDN